MAWKEFRKSGSFKYGCLLLISLLLAVILRAFFFESFRMPSKQMEAAIMSGDFLLADKTSYGLRLWNKQIIESQVAKRNDIVVYKDSTGHIRISRCVALPGDTLEVNRYEYFVNGKKLAQNPDMIIPCQYPLQSDKQIQDCMKKLSIPNRKTSYDQEKGTIFISRYEFYKLKGMLPDSVTIQLSDRNALYYKICIPENSYWMLSDNALVSTDSRYLGFISQDHLIGKVRMIWLSKDPQAGVFHGYRWNRFFLKIN